MPLSLCAFCCVSHTPAAGVGLSLALILARMRSGSMASSSAGDWPRELLDSPPEPIACSVVLTASRAGRLIYKLAVLCPLKNKQCHLVMRQWHILCVWWRRGGGGVHGSGACHHGVDGGGEGGLRIVGLHPQNDEACSSLSFVAEGEAAPWVR